jgi:hypothetical protein
MQEGQEPANTAKKDQMQRASGLFAVFAGYFHWKRIERIHDTNPTMSNPIKKAE